MQCLDFKLEPANSQGRCSADFMIVNSRAKNKYCGEDASVKRSINHGDWLSVFFKTNSRRNNYKGFQCKITCCPNDSLSRTVSNSSSPAIIDAKSSRKGEQFQVFYIYLPPKRVRCH